MWVFSSVIPNLLLKWSTDSYSTQQLMSVPFTSCPCQHLIRSDFLIFGHLGGFVVVSHFAFACIDYALYMCVCCAYSLNHVRLFATPWTVTHQASLFMGFSRQEYWSGLPCPPPGDLPYSGIKPRSPALRADS